MTAPPVDVDAIARELGLTVKLVRHGGKFSGQLVRDRRLIEIEESHHRHRRRFSLGHEIGHWVLKHSSVVCVFDDRSTADPHNRNEREAHTFAAELLMPEPWIREHWRAAGTNWQSLAPMYDVSETALWLRLDKDLNLLGLR
jgi:Zn-dependent peptidase ImmA (M78 family)